MSLSVGVGFGPVRWSKRLSGNRRFRRPSSSNLALFKGALSGANALNKLVFALLALAASPLILAWLAIRSSVGRKVMLGVVIVPAAVVAAGWVAITRRDLDHAARVFQHVARTVTR